LPLTSSGPLGRKARASKTHDDEDEDGPLVTPRTIEDLRDALEAIPSDERELWVRIGLALKTIGPKGKQLWLEWSKKSPKFNLGDAERVWGSMDPRETHFRTVFHEAQNNWDWTNPRSKPNPPGRGERRGP
jgi:hypothetical protein